MPPYDKCIIYRPLGVKKLCEEIAARTGAYGAVIVETREWKKVTILGTSRKVSARKAAHILAKAPFSSRKQYIPMAIIRNYVQGKKTGNDEISDSSFPVFEWTGNKKNRYLPVFYLQIIKICQLFQNEGSGCRHSVLLPCHQP